MCSTVFDRVEPIKIWAEYLGQHVFLPETEHAPFGFSG
jgi:hypothetical protein